MTITESHAVLNSNCALLDKDGKEQRHHWQIMETRHYNPSGMTDRANCRMYTTMRCTKCGKPMQVWEQI